MKKLLTILLLIFLFAGSISGQWIWQQKPMLGHQIDRTHQLGDPVAFWPFNERSGNKVIDLSGNGNTLDFVNSPIWVPGKYGSAILFNDASSQYLSIDRAVASGDSYSFSCWFYTDTVTIAQTLMCIVDKDVANHWARLIIVNAQIRFEEQGGGGTGFGLTPNTFTANTWNHVCGVRVSATERFVILNGGVKGTNATNITPVGLDRTSIGVLAKPGPSNYMSGIIDLPMIYNRDLAVSEIALLYREPFGMFEKDNVAMMAVVAPAPTGGQVIMIQMSAVGIALGLIWLNRRAA